MSETLKYCVECGKAHGNKELWCSGPCFESSTGQGPKVGISQECIDRNIEMGNIVNLSDPEVRSRFFSVDYSKVVPEDKE